MSTDFVSSTMPPRPDNPMPGERLKDARHIVRLPPRDFLPTQAHEAYDAYLGAVEQADALAVRIASREGELRVADEQDRASILAAMRTGDSSEHLGTIARDAVEREHRLLGHREAAAAQVAGERLRALLRILNAHRDDVLMHLDLESEEAGDAYAQAAAALLEARRAYRWIRDRRVWWTDLAATHATRWPPAATEGIEGEHDALRELVHSVRNAVLVDTGARAVTQESR